MEEILTIKVRLTDYIEVKGHTAEAAMILFDGEASGELFEGKILPGGVDTQTQKKGEHRLLSARYILEGKDFTGKQCRLFIENNGIIEENGSIRTVPKILTDSEELAYLEEEELTGTVTSAEYGVVIHINIG